jgi:hypothetical protein
MKQSTATAVRQLCTYAKTIRTLRDRALAALTQIKRISDAVALEFPAEIDRMSEFS